MFAGLWNRWRARWGERKLHPECKWSVSVGGDWIDITDDRGSSVRITLTELHAVTMDMHEGPFGTDWWLLDGANGLMGAFPLGAEHEEEAVRIFQGLPGFDCEKMGHAIRSSSNASFVVWKRKRSDL